MLLRNSFHWASLKQDISNLKLLLISGIGGITERGKRFLILSERLHIKSTLFGIFWYCNHPCYGLPSQNSRMCFRNISFNKNIMQLFGKATTNYKWSAFERHAGWGCVGAAPLCSHVQLWSTAAWGHGVPGSAGGRCQTPDPSLCLHTICSGKCLRQLPEGLSWRDLPTCLVVAMPLGFAAAPEGSWQWRLPDSPGKGAWACTGQPFTVNAILALVNTLVW